MWNGHYETKVRILSNKLDIFRMTQMLLTLKFNGLKNQNTNLDKLCKYEKVVLP